MTTLLLLIYSATDTAPLSLSTFLLNFQRAFTACFDVGNISGSLFIVKHKITGYDNYLLAMKISGVLYSSCRKTTGAINYAL